MDYSYCLFAKKISKIVWGLFSKNSMSSKCMLYFTSCRKDTQYTVNNYIIVQIKKSVFSCCVLKGTYNFLLKGRVGGYMIAATARIEYDNLQVWQGL